jgi:ribonuclease E
MSNKMLIDATHPEETRVVVLRGNRVEEFDFEAADRQQLRGNIYLAKVTRVEPSLQAAFVEYGGNRHGFLAFSEIHPDYYQIPFADRQALIQAQAEEEAEEEAQEAEEERAAEAKAEAAGERTGQLAAADAAYSADDEVSEPAGDQFADGDSFDDDRGGHEEITPDLAESRLSAEPDRDPASSSEFSGSHADEATEDHSAESRSDAGFSEHDGSELGNSGQDASADERPDQFGSAADGQTDGGSDNDHPPHDHHPEEPHHDDTVESVGAVDALEEVPQRRKPRPRQYKIQEVIKRRQVLLVQVVKEERGNKGAALTTYLSLAGRYSVLMPNTGRGGGISRKITNPADRKRLKSIASELDVPEGMGVILRTAGANRTKQEVKRDFEYLLRLWENVRELTLRSTAPKLVYEKAA